MLLLYDMSDEDLKYADFRAVLWYFGLCTGPAALRCSEMMGLPLSPPHRSEVDVRFPFLSLPVTFLIMNELIAPRLPGCSIEHSPPLTFMIQLNIGQPSHGGAHWRCTVGHPAREFCDIRPLAVNTATGWTRPRAGFAPIVS